MFKICIKALFILIFISTPFYSYAESISGLYEKSFEAEYSGDYKKALNSSIEILKKEPGDYYINLRTAWLFYLSHDYDNSEKYYKRAYGINEDSVEPLIGLMLPLMAEKKWQDVINAADDVLRVDPSNYYAKLRKAYSCNEKGEYKTALEIYRSLLGLYPGSLEIKLGLGWVWLNMGNKTEAAFFFGEVLKVSPKNVSALSGMNLIGGM